MSAELNLRPGYPAFDPRFAPAPSLPANDDYGQLMALFAWGTMDPADADQPCVGIDPSAMQMFGAAPAVGASPWLLNDVSSMQQQINMLGDFGQRRAPTMPWQMNFDPLQAQLLVGLLMIGLLMHLDQQRGIAPNLGQSFPGASNGGDDPTSGVPTTPGRDLGHMTGNFREATRRIDGGYNGYDVRIKYNQDALGVV